MLLETARSTESTERYVGLRKEDSFLSSRSTRSRSSINIQPIHGNTQHGTPLDLDKNDYLIHDANMPVRTTRHTLSRQIPLERAVDRRENIRLE